MQITRLINILSIGFLIIISSTRLYAQNLTNNPISYFGIGETNRLFGSIEGGIGQSGLTYVDSTLINYQNPASYSFLAKGQPLFSTAVSGRLSTFSENGYSTFSNVTNMNHFSIAMSNGKRIGLAIGIQPYSRKGYSFNDNIIYSSDTIINGYNGQGSTNEAFLGMSYLVFNKQNSKLSIGLNGGYVFGSLMDQRTSRESSTSFGGIQERTVDINSFHLLTSIYFQHHFVKGNSFAISILVDPSQKFTTNSSQNLYQSSDVNNRQYYYRLDSTGQIHGSITTPLDMSFGINYKIKFRDANKKDGYLKNSEIGFFTDLKIADYSTYKINTGITNNSTNYFNTYRMSLGVQYVPETQFLSSAMNTKLIQRVRYRTGAYYGTLPIQLNNQTRSDYGLTAGFGIPIKVHKSLSSFNLSLGYGFQSNGVKGSLTENYISIGAGIIIAPGSFEKWFVKRKYD